MDQKMSKTEHCLQQMGMINTKKIFGENIGNKRFKSKGVKG